MIGIKHIATELGVSVATISNALAGKGRVSRELGERIRRRAEELGYRPSLAARALKQGRTGILGLVMPDLTNPLFPRIAQTVSIAAERRKLGVLIADSRGSADEQTEAVRRLVGRGVDGLLVVKQRGTVLEPLPVPVAVVNTASDPQNTVSADHAGGGALVARHIADIGHRRVVLYGGDPVSEVQRDRIAGMASALEAGIRARVLWSTGDIAHLLNAVEQGATAILTTSDLLALRVRSALMRVGVSVPEAVSLTGFDDLPLATAMHPALTTVAQNVEAIAERAIESLTRALQGEDGPDIGRTVAMRLVVRESTAIPAFSPNRRHHHD